MFKDKSYKISYSDRWTLLGLLIDIFATGWARMQSLIDSLVPKRMDIVQATWACRNGFIDGLRIDTCSDIFVNLTQTEKPLSCVVRFTSFIRYSITSERRLKTKPSNLLHTYNLIDTIWWNPHNGIRTVEFVRWIRTTELAPWYPHNRSAKISP